MEIRDELNRLYEPLCRKAREISAALTRLHGGFRSTWGFYNGHSHKGADGRYYEDAYPIPVLSVAGLCDIEIDVDGIGLTAKLTKEQAMNFDGASTLHRHFEAYGVEDYLADYGDERDLAGMKARMENSGEKEFFFTFAFPNSTSGEELRKFLHTLQAQGFYY